MTDDNTYKKKDKNLTLDKDSYKQTDLLNSVKGQLLKRAPASLENKFTVVKRNGSLVPYKRERIYLAIEAAFKDVKKIQDGLPLPAEMIHTIEHVTTLVSDQVSNLASKGVSITVEGIQDIVEITLMKAGFHDVARGYIIYRNEHKAIRQDSSQNLKIYRKDEDVAVRFNPMKIASTLESIFRSHHEVEGPASDEIVEAVNLLTEKVVENALEFSRIEPKMHVSHIQDMIENALMAEGYFGVAKDYILTRAKLGEQVIRQSETLEKKKVTDKQRKYDVMNEQGETKSVNETEIKKHMKYAARGLEDIISINDLVEATILNFYDGIKEKEIDISHIMAAKSKIEKEPAYSKVAARLLLDSLYRESVGIKASSPKLQKDHKEYFKWYIKHGITIDRLGKDLLIFDLDVLADAMVLERDDKFQYLGLQTLYDRYFIHENQRRLETPQIFWMRVAMGLSLREDNPTERAIEFYNILSEFHYTSATPTLFNSGTAHSQLSSCYLSTVMDDLHHIFKVVADDAQLSKWAGGIGNDWTNVRATGALIKGTNGQSQGVIPFLKVANDTAVAVNQCFAPETLIYTSEGTKAIADVNIGDLVLGISGTYREVTDRFIYNQHDPMVAIDVKHSVEPLAVTAGHPFYAIRHVPEEQSIQRTLNSLKKGTFKSEWVDAGNLQAGDYIAQVIPKEIVADDAIDEDDARLYGILLGDGHLTENGYEWGISVNPKSDTHLTFIREYLSKKQIHFWETTRGDTYLQIRFSFGKGLVRSGTTGQFVSGVGSCIPFAKEDLYDSQKRKHIAPRLSHLPKPQALSMIQGLLETDGTISRGKEVTFTNTSQPLVEGLRYQLLRMGIPTSGNRRVRHHHHSAKRSDGSEIKFNNTTTSYDLRIPATKELADRLGCKTVTKFNWFVWNDAIFSRVKKVEPIQTTPFVIDLQVEGDESYMTTSGLAHNGGKRKGAMCAYLETWHLDIEDFLELRKNTGDERRRTHDMNTANWIPDLFMKRVMSGGKWTLFSPNNVPDLHDLYGQAFEKRYEEYEKMAANGIIKLFKTVEATDLWRKMLSMLFETGHPWITFKDPSNIRSPQDHVGVVHSSNLCTEILLNSSEHETAVCNLGSINLVEHVTKNGIDEEKLAKTIKTAIRMLDNVIDINFYPIKEAENSNLKHRPIGLGIMGFQDALYIQDISYASHQAVEFADYCQELVAYYAILASSNLAKERGPYFSYKGSKWDRGYLPLDTLKLLEEERQDTIDVDRSSKKDWNVVRESIKKYGMRNSNTMAIAPTATIANIIGVTSSVEPAYKQLFVKSNLSGDFTVPNSYLVDKLKSLNLWDDEMLDDLKYFDGSLKEIERIPESVRNVYLTAFEIDPDWVIECGARRQKWIDMGQSLNLYLAETSGKKLHQMYTSGWKKGLKTTYYLRSLGATQIEKSTTDINKRALQPRWMKNASPSSRIKVEREETPSSSAKPIVCNLGEACESCQ